ncbi:MAG: transcription termination factor Rho [Actinomycetota bacterium]|nr:transcription termination factor Rho [Actinomycetota bacterium]
MAAEQQLERSVLERKERDELRAIAQAMSLDTNSRTKKADIIAKILVAAGVEVGSSDGAEVSSSDVVVSRERSTKPRVSRRAVLDASDGHDDAAAEGASTGAERATNGSTPSTASGAGAGAASVITQPSLLTAGPDARDQGDQDAAPGPAETAGRGTPSANGSSLASSSANGSSVASGATSLDAPGAAAGAVGERSPAHANGEQAAQGLATDSRQLVQGQPKQNQSRQSRPPGQSAQHQGNELGNRRGRRRRGRERPGQERGELQGGGLEPQYQGDLVPVRGLLDMRDEGYGFLRCEGYLPSQRDAYVSISQAKRFALRKGDFVEGACRPAGSTEKFPALVRIDSVSGMTPDEARNRPRFEDLTPLFPDAKLRLESPGSAENVTARIIDLLAPIGKGQRGLIVSPPKAGKTTVMKQIAHSIEANNPEVYLMVLLVDERPEEVTDMRRSVKGDVIASTFDRPAEEHTQVAELVIERAKRLVESGTDVVIILDGITRLARAYNLAQPTSGRVMSGGVDSGALYPPKKFFGAARNIEEGGSLTILATALVETGSKMDEVIFEEFKGTGNMELRLDRRLAERRLYPSIDVNASSTRHEELLFDRGQLQQVWKLRRVLNALAAEGSAAAGLELLMDRIRTTRSNDEFLAEIAKGPAPPT